MIAEIQTALQNANVRAFLRLLRYTEGTGQTERAYRVLFGGGTFEGFQDHPRKALTYKLGQSEITSTAAGAYQFLSRTWDECKQALGLPDFGPDSQDLAAVFLIRRRKALDDLIAGNLDEAIEKCSREWASLPGSPYGQPVKSLSECRSVYQAHGGTINAPATPAASQEVPLTEVGSGAPIPPGEAPDWPPKEKPMDPFIGAALGAVIKAAPDLIDMFKGESKSAQRNSEAAKVVVGVAKEALQAKNEQEVVQKLEADPAAAEAVREAIRKNWFEIHKANEQSIAEARKFAVEWSSRKNVRTVVGRFTFIEFLALVFLLTAWAAIGLLAAFNKISENTLDNIIMIAAVASIAGVREFWYGSSLGSREKDQRQ